MTKTKGKTRPTADDLAQALAELGAEVEASQGSPRSAQLQLVREPGVTDAQLLGRSMIDPAIHASFVSVNFEHLFGGRTDFTELVGALKESIARVKGGDVSDMESMLLAQSVALQSMFTGLFSRAQGQTETRNFEALMNLALKAQAQSRATISALVDLKFPRQAATFIRQANVANGGPQQVVNNGAPQGSRTEAGATAPNEVLGEAHGQVIGVDTGTPGTATRRDSALAPVGAINRPAQRRRQATRVA